MKKRILALALALPLMATLAAPALAAPAPKPADPASLTWDAKFAVAHELTAGTSKRTDATGDKIASNAQSAEFPGLYFYWNDKQKEPGVLLVDPSVFDWFVDGQFVITAKNSNNYWDYAITQDPNQLIDGVYAYAIPKTFQYLNAKGQKQTEDLKNINMIFIDGNWKTADLTIKKVWSDENGPISDLAAYTAGLGCASSPTATFNNGAYGVGTYPIRTMGKTVSMTITEDVPAWKCTVQTLYGERDVWFALTAVNGDSTATSATVDLTYQEPPVETVVTFENSLVLGDERIAKQSLTIEKVWLDANGDVVDDPALVAAYNNSLTFNDNYALGKATDPVLAGSQVVITEESNWEGCTAPYYCYFVQDSVTVNGDPVTSVNFTVQKGTDYTVVFTNKMVVELLTPSQEAGKIPSTQHADRWWDEYGIIVYGASTTSNGSYFVAVGPDFWLTHTSIVIGFGTLGNYSYMIEVTENGVTDVNNLVIGTGSGTIGCHYSCDASKVHDLTGMITYTFDSPYGSGARQAYLVSVN